METVNHNFVFRYIIIQLYCDMFRLILKKPLSGKLKISKKNYHAHHIEAFNINQNMSQKNYP
jgi:hypothetical protein